MDNLNLITFPFKEISIFKLENFLDENLYLELNKGFKEYCLDDFKSKNFLDKKNLKYCFNSKMEIYEKVLNRFDAVKQLHDLVNSKKFFNFLIKKLYFKFLFSSKSSLKRQIRFLKIPHLQRDIQQLREYRRLDSHGVEVVDEQFYSNSNNLKDKIFNLFFNRIRVTLEFTYILNKGKIVPHTDDTNKLLSFSLFFPKYQTAEKTKKNKDLYEKEKNIGTVFWKSDYKSYENIHQEGSSEGRFKTKYKKMLQLPFEGRHLFGFIKNDVSWHSVEPFDITDDYIRHAIIINFRLI